MVSIEDVRGLASRGYAKWEMQCLILRGTIMRGTLHFPNKSDNGKYEIKNAISSRDANNLNQGRID
jgi:hypothetical protein